MEEEKPSSDDQIQTSIVPIVETTDEVAKETTDESVSSTPLVMDISKDESNKGSVAVDMVEMPEVDSETKTNDSSDSAEPSTSTTESPTKSQSIMDEMKNLVAKAADSSEHILCIYMNKDGQVCMGTERGEKFVESSGNLLADFEKFCQASRAKEKLKLEKLALQLVPNDDFEEDDKNDDDNDIDQDTLTLKEATEKKSSASKTKDSDSKEKEDTHLDGWDLGEWQIEREKCPHCDKTFKDKIYLKQHMDMHSDLNYLCPICGKDFIMKRYVHMHAKRVHNQNLKSNDKIGTVEAKLKCDYCPLKFAFQPSLNEHSAREHPEEEKAKMKRSGGEKKIKEEKEDEKIADVKGSKKTVYAKGEKKGKDEAKAKDRKDAVVNEEEEEEASESEEESPPRKRARSDRIKKVQEKATPTSQNKVVKAETRQRSPRGKSEMKTEVRTPATAVNREETVVGRSRSGRKIRFPGWKYGDDMESSSPVKKPAEESTSSKRPARSVKKKELEEEESKTDTPKRSKRKIKEDEVDKEKAEDLDSDYSEDSKVEDSDEKYKCPYCTKTFRLKRHLDKHTSDNHEYECMYCSKLLHTKADLKKHESKCDRAEKKTTKTPKAKPDLSCKVCRKSFMSKEALDKHGNVHLSKIRKCPKCSRSVTGNRNFQLHLKKNHSDVKEQEEIFKLLDIVPLTCGKCKSPFIDEETLEQHMKRVHSSEEKEDSQQSLEETSSADEELKKQKDEDETVGKDNNKEADEGNEKAVAVKEEVEIEEKEEKTEESMVKENNEVSIVNEENEDELEENEIYPLEEMIVDENDEDDDQEEVSLLEDINFTSKASEKRERRKKGVGDKLLHGRCKVKRIGGKIGYNCLICNKLLSNRLTAVRHMERHDEELMFEKECHLCFNKFENEVKLGAHLRSVHLKTGAFSCSKCNQKFMTAMYCREHMKSCTGETVTVVNENGETKEDTLNSLSQGQSDSNKQDGPPLTKCIICGARFDTEEDAKYHLHFHCTEEGKWICPYCAEGGGIFSDKGWLVQHIMKFHDLKHFLPDVSTDPDNLQCSFCLKKLSTKMALEKHLLLHQNSDNNCKICFKQFSFPYQLRNHMAIHDNKMNYTCPICQQKFKLKRYMQKHMQDVHKFTPSRTHVGPRCNFCPETQHFENLDEVYSHAIEEHPAKLEEMLKRTLKDDKECFVCKQCFKSYGSEKEYVTHVVCHTKRTPLMCETCGRYFEYKTKLKIHQATHLVDKTYECHVCHGKYSNIYNLKAHMRRHTMTPVVCDTCGMTFKTKDTLQSHMRVHDDTKRFSCEVCGYQTRTFDGYKCHLVGTHPDVAVHKKGWKIYTCEYCNKLSSGKQQHVRHVATHTGEMPFKCPHCDYKYATKGALNVHIRSHIDSEKPFFCEPCDLKFLWANKMQKHMESVRHLQACAQAGIEPAVVEEAFAVQFNARRSRSNRGYHANRNSGSRRGVKKINFSNRNKDKIRRTIRQKRPRMTQKVIYVTHPPDQIVGEESIENWGVYEEEVPQQDGEAVTEVTTETQEIQISGPNEIQIGGQSHEIQIVEPTEEETLEIATSMSAEELAQGNTEYVIITVPQDTQLDPQRMVYDIQAAVQSILK